MVNNIALFFFIVFIHTQIDTIFKISFSVDFCIVSITNMLLLDFVGFVCAITK